jgi:hypothetical protein
MINDLDQLVERELAGKIQVRGEELTQYHSDHHKSLMTWPAIEGVNSDWVGKM